MIAYNYNSQIEKMPELDTIRALCDVKEEINTLDVLGIDYDTFIESMNINLVYSSKVDNNIVINKPRVDIIFDGNSTEFRVINQDFDSYRLTDEKINEFKVKAVILNLLYSRLKKEGLIWIDKLRLVDVYELEKGNRIDQYIDELAARILIPNNEFNEKVAEEIYSVYNKSNEGEANIIDFATLRKLFVENLKRKYKVSDYMANLRIKCANFPRKIGYEETLAVNEFVRYEDADLGKENTPKITRK